MPFGPIFTPQKPVPYLLYQQFKTHESDSPVSSQSSRSGNPRSKNAQPLTIPVTHRHRPSPSHLQEPGHEDLLKTNPLASLQKQPDDGEQFRTAADDLRQSLPQQSALHPRSPVNVYRLQPPTSKLLNPLYLREGSAELRIDVDESRAMPSSLIHISPSLLPPDHPPRFSKRSKKLKAHQTDPLKSSQRSEFSEPDEVDSPGRSSLTSSPSPDLSSPIIHAPAPRRIHALARPIAVASAAPTRFLQSVPMSEAERGSVDRGWSTAPSLLGQAPAVPSNAVPLSQPYREPHIPKRLKNRRIGPERSALGKEVVPPQRREFLIPKRSKSRRTSLPVSNDVVDRDDISCSNPVAASLVLCEDHNLDSPVPPATPPCFQLPARPISVPPPVDSDDSVLDDFVVDSSLAYTSIPRESDSCSADLAAQAQKLCNAFLGVFKNLERYKTFLEYRGERAQVVIDSMQSLLDGGFVEPQFRVILVVALSRLARKSELFPKRFILHNVICRGETLDEGHFGGIEKGYWDGKVIQALSREIMPWGQLCHENILPFYGISYIDGEGGKLGLVSPFLENGNVVQFLKRYPNVDRLSLIFGVAAGMSYLHNNGLVHGDIKGQNILVTDTVPPRACLADFGFTTITDVHGLRSSELSSNAAEGGTTQFEAPELLDPKIPYRRTEASDVYAFAMACYEIFTGSIPFPGRREVHVIFMVGQLGKRPPRPLEQIYRDRGLSDLMWQLIENAWSQDPVARPTAHLILESLSKELRAIDPVYVGNGWGDLTPSWFANHSSKSASLSFEN
ncbi:hypothetical protein H0H92_004134 [Tricholoma furcatifolium]|nr:hypothetical protein H0H92_004134 [Tricholoma furcatifolium]